jgi:hypothetical protein
MTTHDAVEEFRKLLNETVSLQGEDVGDLVDEIRPFLAGHSPAMQGAALADLVAIWIAGHHPSLRQAMFDMHVQAVPGLVEINDKLMYGDDGFPGSE